MRLILNASLLVLAMLGGTSVTASPQQPMYVRAGDIAAPDGRWDLVSWDAEHHHLLVAHGKDVLIIDPAQANGVRAIGDVAGAHQVLALPGSNHLLVTSGHDNTVRIIDGGSGAPLASIAVAEGPDAAILSPDGRRAYVMASKAGAVSVIDLASLAETGRIAVKPGLELPAWVDDHTLAINDEEASEIELVDTAAGKPVGVIALPGCDGPTGLAYARPQHLALSACGNGKAAIIDMVRRQLVTLVAIGQGPDTAIWDGRHNRFLVPCGRSGTLSVITLDRTGAHPVAEVPTEMSARTAALDPASGRVFLPSAHFAPAAPAGQRPPMVPGSFHIVVLSPQD